MDFFTHPAYKTAAKELVATAIATDYLRKMNVDERPKVLEKVKEWRPEVYEILITRYPQHC